MISAECVAVRGHLGVTVCVPYARPAVESSRAERLSCEECGREQADGERGWKAYRTFEETSPGDARFLPGVRRPRVRFARPLEQGSEVRAPRPVRDSRATLDAVRKTHVTHIL